MSTMLMKILEEVKTLSAEERVQLQSLLQAWRPQPPRSVTEEELLQRLAAQGVVSLPSGQFHQATPVRCTGKSVSELIVEDRR